MATSTISLVIASTVTGVLEIVIFHPIDTIIKRLMTNTSRITGGNLANSTKNFLKVIFSEAYNSGIFQKLRSLFPGICVATAYKISQRIYKFGGQPLVKDFLSQTMGSSFDRSFGANSKAVQHALAGAMVGVGEVVLQPLDVLKIRRQTNPSSLEIRWHETFKKEGLALYRGVGWTAARNLTGSCVLFGVACLVKDHVFCLDNHNDATFSQILAASTAGALTCITVASPLDVVKTRIQKRKYEDPEKGFSIVRNMIRHEGVSAFWKGFFPKAMVLGPKLIFAFSTTQFLGNSFDRLLYPVHAEKFSSIRQNG